MKWKGLKKDELKISKPKGQETGESLTRKIRKQEASTVKQQQLKVINKL